VLKQFLHYMHGNVTMTFAVGAVPLIAAVGAAIDYSDAQEQRGVVQSALDRASLGAGQLVGLVPADDVRAKARTLYQSGVGGRLSVPPPVNVSLADGKVSLGTELRVPTRFLRLIGLDQFVFNLHGEAATGAMTYEVALVLDNSGSMAGSRIQTLRQAASDLTRSLFAANRLNPSPDPVRIAVVPFAGAVNVGPDKAAAAWIDGKARAPGHLENFENARPAAGNRLALFDALSDVSWAGCVEARPHPLDVSDAPPTEDDPATLFVPMFAPDEPDLNGFDNNYIADASAACTGADALPTRTGTARQAEARLCKYTDAAPLPVGHNNGTVVGPNLNCTSSPVMALSDDEPKILARIDSLDARGTTNIHAGVMWGWRLLSPELPFVEGRSTADRNNRKILIVMTDGANSYDTYANFNRSMYGAFGYVANGHLDTTSADPSRVRAKLDERTLEACANAGSEGGVHIYTVAFQVSDPATVGLLERCASAPEMAFRSDSDGELITTFQQIARDISTLRLAE
jgi:Putative Flp pilus-assembly TadE/G-like